MSRDDATLVDTAKAARWVIEFARGCDQEQFLHDAKTQSAILHQLLVLGEATKRLSSAFRDRHADVPWPLIAGMRDKLIHAYDAVDLEQVWRTATRDVPELLTKLNAILPPDEA